MFGPHNVLNSLTGFAVGHDIGLDAEKIAKAIAQFSGVKRRFTTTGIANNITVIDDYAHHPVEIASVLKAGRDAVEGKGGGRIIAVMQPHRYTRLKNLFEPFCSCFELADEVIIADVYTAGEEPIEGANRDTLVEGIKKTGHKSAQAMQKPEDLPAMIAKIAKPGDFVICLGAGTITQWAYALPAALDGIFGTAPKTASGS